MIGILVAAALQAASAPAPRATMIQMLWLGDHDCGSWPKGSVQGAEKAAVANWTLGFLSGRAASARLDYLANVTQPSLSAWLDNYCAAHPLDDLTTASLALERELKARARSHIPVDK